jgi:hypothetical protein
MSVKKSIASHPTLFGASVGLIIFVGIIVMETWFPGVGRAWERHDELVRSVWCTIGLFGICVHFFWDWQRRGRRVFWLSMGIFFFLHVLGVSLYWVYVGPVLLWQWIILCLLEGYAAAFFVGWSTHKFGHTTRHQTDEAQDRKGTNGGWAQT